MKNLGIFLIVYSYIYSEKKLVYLFMFYMVATLYNTIYSQLK